MKKNQRLNIIDLECTCWENQQTPNGQHQSNHMEIIEIGIVQIDVRSLDILNKKSYLVVPVDYGISDFCTNLTGITSEMIMKDGNTLKFAINEMVQEFDTQRYQFTSWGDFDRIQFQKECSRKGINYPFNETHTNLKYSLAVLTRQHQKGVSKMLKFLHMNFEGNPHRGIDDAINIAKMYIEIHKQLSLQNLIDSGHWG